MITNAQTITLAVAGPLFAFGPIHAISPKSPAKKTKIVPAGMVAIPRKTRNRER
jgi:hypothetical protein